MREGRWGRYFSAEVICRGSGMSTAQACTVLGIGHQETRAGARDVLTCADGLGSLFVVFVRGQLYPDEGQVIVVQYLLQVWSYLRYVVWCFTSGKHVRTICEFCATIRPRRLLVADAELFIRLYSPCACESDGLCDRIDRVRNVRSVGAVEEGACDEIVR